MNDKNIDFLSMLLSVDVDLNIFIVLILGVNGSLNSGVKLFLDRRTDSLPLRTV